MSCPTDKPEDFQPVQSRNKKRRKKLAGVPAVVSFSTRLDKFVGEISDTEWLKQCRKKIEESFRNLAWAPPKVFVLCLGLGSPMGSQSAAVQLAFITSVCDFFDIGRNRVSFFDPCFSQEDVKGLLAMDFHVLTDNKRGKYPIASKTLLFMPHCGLELYENILQENWGADLPQRFLLLGNILQEYATVCRTPDWKFGQKTPCVSRICKYLTCDPISQLDPYPLAFMCLGLQYIDSVTLCEDSLWNPPPVVTDIGTSEEVT